MWNKIYRNSCDVLWENSNFLNNKNEKFMKNWNKKIQRKLPFAEQELYWSKCRKWIYLKNVFKFKKIATKGYCSHKLFSCFVGICKLLEFVET